MKSLISTFCAILMPLLCSAAVNLLSLTAQPGPINYIVSKNLLPLAYLHNSQLLAQATVEIIKSETCANTKAIVCSVRHNDIATEYYLVTISTKHGMVVDGLMLGHDGDSQILKIVTPHDEMVYEPKLKIDISFNQDTIKVARTYNFYSTALGGRTIEKRGTIYNCFVIGNDSKISQLRPTATAIETVGDANYLSKDRKPTVTRQTDGEFFPMGMAVLEMAQSPVSKGLDMKALNNNADGMMQIIEKHGNNAKETPETMSVVEFTRWSFNMGMRHSNEFLTWIARNHKEEKFTHFIEACVKENATGELDWLKENVKNLNDKKARKWWQKWIKDNLK